MHPGPQFNSAESTPHWLQLSPAGERLKTFLSRWRLTNCINSTDVFSCESMTPTSSWKWDSRIAWYYHFIVYEWSYEQRPYLFPSRGGVTYPFLSSDVCDASVGESIIFAQISSWIIIFCVLSLFSNVPSGMFCFENCVVAVRHAAGF